VNTEAHANGREPVLELRALSKSFGGLRAVRDVTLKIMPGDRKAIIGPNGAGKTTLFNLITGIFPATSGQVVLFGQDVTRWPSHRRTALGMARTFQITSLFPKLTVLDNVLLAIQGLRRSKFVMWRFLSSYRDFYDRAHGLLERARFLDRKDTEVRYLSHGEQRQLEIILGLASDPKILLLDEPAAGLSSGESSEMIRFLAHLDRNLAILLIEHDMDVVFDVAEHISVLHFGEILEAGAALLGRNGVGKTTLVNSIVGFNRPRRGKVLFKGTDITEVSSFETVRSGMGLVPQGRRVFPTLSVEENLMVAERSVDRRGWNMERVYALFPRLRERRSQRARTLSGGEQQMLAIGRGLMTNPDCLIMDEPSEGLAPIIIQGLWQAIARLKEEGHSILLVEQNASLALQLVDYVHVMSKGQVVYSARPEELRANDEIKSRYLGI
jgi:ABC-type branched-subunit amino acid transport system ATPase component